jgi:hypothetical protein
MDAVPAVLAAERRRTVDLIRLCPEARRAPTVLELRTVDWALVSVDDECVTFELLDGESLAFDLVELRTHIGATLCSPRGGGQAR